LVSGSCGPSTRFREGSIRSVVGRSCGRSAGRDRRRRRWGGACPASRWTIGTFGEAGRGWVAFDRGVVGSCAVSGAIRRRGLLSRPRWAVIRPSRLTDSRFSHMYMCGGSSMFAKTNFGCRSREGRRFGFGSLSGPLLYSVTLAGEIVISGGARFCLGFGGIFAVRIFLGCPCGPRAAGEMAALAPVLWSLVALGLPGRCWVWRRRVGARRPAVHEVSVIEMALEALGEDPSVMRRIWIVDDSLPTAATRGGLVVLSRGLLGQPGLRPVLAHEFGHLHSVDGRLTDALERFGLWGDALRMPDDDPVGDGIAVALVWLALRILVAAAGARPMARALRPLWAMHWRGREYRADAYAASLGQASGLIDHLEGYAQVLDRPQAGFLLGDFEHPPVALRVSRLRRGLEASPTR
jgi:Zn-dependent protease with chaperone function